MEGSVLPGKIPFTSSYFLWSSRLVDFPARGWLNDVFWLGRMKVKENFPVTTAEVELAPEEVGKFVEALREAGVPNDIHIYDGVNHAFWLFVEEDFAKRNTAALDVWQRLKAYLSRTIGN